MSTYGLSFIKTNKEMDDLCRKSLILSANKKAWELYPRLITRLQLVEEDNKETIILSMGE